MECLQKIELPEKDIDWCSAHEIEQYLFDSEQILLVFSNFARALSHPALMWYQNRKISALIKVIGREIDDRFDQLARYECISNMQCFNGLTYNLSHTSRDLIDITDFCNSLEKQTKSDCKERLPQPLSLKPDTVKELAYSWENLESSIQAVNEFTFFGAGIKKIQLFRSVFQCAPRRISSVY